MGVHDRGLNPRECSRNHCDIEEKHARFRLDERCTLAWKLSRVTVSTKAEENHTHVSTYRERTPEEAQTHQAIVSYYRHVNRLEDRAKNTRRKLGASPSDFPSRYHLLTHSLGVEHHFAALGCRFVGRKRKNQNNDKHLEVLFWWYLGKPIKPDTE